MICHYCIVALLLFYRTGLFGENRLEVHVTPIFLLVIKQVCNYMIVLWLLGLCASHNTWNLIIAVFHTIQKVAGQTVLLRVCSNDRVEFVKCCTCVSFPLIWSSKRMVVGLKIANYWRPSILWLLLLCHLEKICLGELAFVVIYQFKIPFVNCMWFFINAGDQPFLYVPNFLLCPVVRWWVWVLRFCYTHHIYRIYSFNYLLYT